MGIGSKNIRNIRNGRLESANPGMNPKRLKRLNNANSRIGRQYVERGGFMVGSMRQLLSRANP